MTHKITSVLLWITRLKTLTLDLLNWLYYPEQLLPFSQVNYLSQCRVGKNLVALSIPIRPLPPDPPPHLQEKSELSLRRHSTL